MPPDARAPRRVVYAINTGESPSPCFAATPGFDARYFSLRFRPAPPRRPIHHFSAPHAAGSVGA